MLSRPHRCCFVMRTLNLPTPHISCLSIIALGCLDRDVARQELDLLQFAFSGVAQLRTRAPRVLGRDGPEASSPAYCFTACQTRRSVTPSPQHLPARQTQRNSLAAWSSAAATPIIDRRFDPAWHRYGPDVPAFTDQINNRPMLLSLLQMREVQISQSRLRRPQPSTTARIARPRLPLSVWASGTANTCALPVP